MKSKSSPQGSLDHPIDPIRFALGAGATFVARTVDVDAKHLQETLHRAHAHKGTAFVEILQNCPVFNDGEWNEVEDKKTRDAATLVLRAGQPLVCGDEDNRHGIRMEHGRPTLVPLPAGTDPREVGITVHNEASDSPAYSYQLATLARPRFPLPIGVLRCVSRPTYEELLDDQVQEAIEQRGRGDLRKLLHSGDTWTVGG
jgi:2-oxoglutarate ferredoxin oxidoreductase subunit beta